MDLGKHHPTHGMELRASLALGPWRHALPLPGQGRLPSSHLLLEQPPTYLTEASSQSQKANKDKEGPSRSSWELGVRGHSQGHWRDGQYEGE